MGLGGSGLGRKRWNYGCRQYRARAFQSESYGRHRGGCVRLQLAAQFHSGGTSATSTECVGADVITVVIGKLRFVVNGYDRHAGRRARNRTYLNPPRIGT